MEKAPWSTPLLIPHPQHTAARLLGLLLIGRKARAAMTSEICGSEGVREGGGGGRRRKNAFPKQLFHRSPVHTCCPLQPWRGGGCTGTSDFEVWGGEGREVGTGLFAVSLWTPRHLSELRFPPPTWRYRGLLRTVVGGVHQMLFLRKPAQSRHTAGLHGASFS